MNDAIKSENTPGAVSPVRSDDLLAAAFDLVSASRRVRSKFGTDDNGNPLDWTEWRDVDDACNAIDRIAANARPHAPERSAGA
jgi:acyl-CoA reductase-like NAD-dependent aldehyde dehydrogenase